MPTARKHMAEWSAADVKKMRALAKRGKSTAEVAKTLGRSPGALRYKAHVSGVSFRELRAA